jgi:hypothetical protein
MATAALLLQVLRKEHSMLQQFMMAVRVNVMTQFQLAHCLVSAYPW